MDAITLAEWQLVATAVVGVITIFTYFRIARLSDKSNSFNRLDDELNNIVNTWVKYPYLEDLDFIERFHKKEADKTDGLRYDAYCTLVFNYIESLYKHFKGNAKKMASYNEYKEMIVVHNDWWTENQSDDLTAYTGEFKTFVQSVVDNL